MSSNCPNISSCPIFPLFQLNGSLKAWQDRYCQAAYTLCERYKRSVDGKMTPMNLLPNGEMLVLGAKGQP